MPRTDIAPTLAALREAKLRQIGPLIRALDADQARAASAEIQRLLTRTVEGRELSPDHRWLLTSLQFLAPDDVGPLLAQALRQALRLEDCCGCSVNRTLRALGAVTPVEAIPALVDAICEAEPRHQHLAAVCLLKVAAARDRRAETLLAVAQPRLKSALKRLERAVAATPPVTPRHDWMHLPGSPRWRAACERAIRSLRKLIRPAPAATRARATTAASSR